MKASTVFLFPLLCLAAEGPNEIDSLVDRARGVEGEFAADAMIRIASVSRVEKTRKVQLLEEAFLRAGEAQQPYKRHPAMSRQDLPGGFQNRAYGQDMDALSLRLRVVEAMAQLDGRKAVDLFSRIPRPTLPAVKCEDFLVYDVGRFYDVAAMLAHQSFTAKEVAHGEPMQLLALEAGGIASPVEVGPAARMIAAAGMKDDDFQLLLSSFSTALGRISGDDRSFTYSLKSVGSQIVALVEECKRRRVSPLGLIERYRLYLVTNLSAARCADDGLMQVSTGITFNMATGKAVDDQGPDAVALFNEAIRVPPLARIEDSEVASSAPSGGTIADLNACQDPQCKAIQTAFQGLLLKENGGPMQSADRDTEEWQGKLREFLTAMAGWKESTGAAAAQHFRDKSGMYDLVFQLAPTGRPREMVLESLLDYLRQSRFQVESRIEWFLPAHALVTQVGLDPRGSKWVADRLRGANDPVIALYANLELVAPHTVESASGVL